MAYESNIWKLNTFTFLSSLMFISGVLVPFFLDWGQISFTQIMLLQSLFVISVFLLEVPTGAIADRFSRKAALALGSVIGAIAALVYGSVPNFWIFATGEFLFAVGFSLISGAAEALVYDSLKADGQDGISKRIFGRFNSYQVGGIMISAPIGSAIGAYIGLRYSMLLFAVPMLLSVFFALSIKEPDVKTEKKTYFKTMHKAIRYFRRHRTLKILAFDRIAVYSLVFMLIWMYQPVLTTLSVPIVYFGFVSAALAGVQILALNRFSWLEERFGSKKRYLMLSAIIAGGCMILLGASTSIVLTIVLILIASGFGLSRHILFDNYMNKHIESENRATVLSLVSMIGRLVMGLLYPIVGLLVEWSLSMALAVIGGLVIVSALVSRVEEVHLLD